jgi:hypothetical protein
MMNSLILYSYYLLIFLCIHLIYTSKIELGELFCNKDDSCYGSLICQRYKLSVNEIKPEFLSKETCFHNENIVFKMGTDRPLIKNDGESPSKRIELNSFCIDQTEVSNLQFYQFVVETGYRTEVTTDRKYK